MLCLFRRPCFAVRSVSEKHSSLYTWFLRLKTGVSAKHSGEHPACFWEGFETRQSYRCLWSVKQKNRLQRKVKVVCTLVDRPRSVQREEKRTCQEARIKGIIPRIKARIWGPDRSVLSSCLPSSTLSTGQGCLFIY